MDKLLKLFEFQKVDLELYNLENSIKKSDSRKKLAMARNVLLDGQKTAEQFEKDIENKKNEIEAVMEEYKQMSEEIQQVVAQSNDVTEIDDAKKMKKTAETLNFNLKRFQKAIIDGLNEVKDTQKKYHDLMMILQKAKKDFIENKEIHSKEIEQAQGKIDELKANIENLEKDLDKALYEKYKEKKKNCMPVLVEVKDKQCGGCFMELPSSFVDNAKNTADVVECENCGRILLFN